MPLRFRDASAALIPNPAERSYGCVIAPFQRNTAHPQIAVVTVDGPNRLYRFDGDAFVDVADEAFADRGRSGIGCAAADVDGSGRLALYVLNTDRFLGETTHSDALLMQSAGGSFYDLARTYPDLIDPPNRGAGRSVCFLDITGNGFPDCYVANYGVPCLFYINRGRGSDELGGAGWEGSGGWGGFVNAAAPGEGLGVVTGGRSLVAADFFGSGRLDLFAGNEQSRNCFWINHGVSPEGQLRLTDEAVRRGLDDPNQHARGVAVGDFDRDGRLDIAYANWEGPHRLLMQRPDGTFENVASPEFAEPSRCRNVIAADFDNDGHLDLFFNNIGEPNRLFLNNGDGTFRKASGREMPEALLLPGGLGTGATVGDLTGNGRLDLFIAHGEQADVPNVLLLNETENDHHWLSVHALTDAGSPAVGAAVRLRFDTTRPGNGSDGRPQVRFIDGGSGYLCQMEPVAHFGLGDAARVAEVRVRWTDGRERVLRDVPADQRLIVRPPAAGR